MDITVAPDDIGPTLVEEQRGVMERTVDFVALPVGRSYVLCPEDIGLLLVVGDEEGVEDSILMRPLRRL